MPSVRLRSDLDWGQDLHRLRDECRERGIDELWIAYFGRADLAKHGLPAGLHELEPNERPLGRVAASLCMIRSRGGGGYRWLEAHEPVAPIGKTILLYRFE